MASTPKTGSGKSKHSSEASPESVSTKPKTKPSPKAQKVKLEAEKLAVSGKKEAHTEELEDSSSATSTASDSSSEELDNLQATSSAAPSSIATATTTDSPKKKLSWLDKKKKGLASRAAGSSLGNSLFEKYVDKDTQMLIDSICSIIESENGSKAAKKTKSEILKVAVKILLLYNSNKVTEENFETLGFSFRRICSSVRNAYHAKSLNEATATRIHGVATIFYQNLQNSLDGLVSDNTIQRIKALIDYVFSPALLTAAAKYDKQFQQIAMVLALYLETSS